MASQITSVSMVCSTVCSGADQRKHQSSASQASVGGGGGGGNSPVTREFPSQTVSNAENISISWRHHAIEQYLTYCLPILSLFLSWYALEIILYKITTMRIYALLYELCFLWFTNCILLSDDNSLITGCLWLLALGIWCSPIPHHPGCFVPGPSFRILDFTWCHRNPLCHIYLLNLDILQGSFRLCNWLSLRRLVSWINYLPPACWSTFWKSIFKHQLGCRFDILDSISSFFVFWHM